MHQCVGISGSVEQTKENPNGANEILLEKKMGKNRAVFLRAPWMLLLQASGTKHPPPGAVAENVHTWMLLDGEQEARKRGEGAGGVVEVLNYFIKLGDLGFSGKIGSLGG